MLPGFKRSFATPASIAASAMLVVEVDVGDDRHRRALHDVRQARGVARILARDANDLAACHRQAVDLLERLVVRRPCRSSSSTARRSGDRRRSRRPLASDSPVLFLRKTGLDSRRKRIMMLSSRPSHLKRGLARDDAGDVVVGHGEHHDDQRGEPADVHERFLFRVDRLAAQHLDEDEDARARRRAPGSAAG